MIAVVQQKQCKAIEWKKDCQLWPKINSWSNLSQEFTPSLFVCFHNDSYSCFWAWTYAWLSAAGQSSQSHTMPQNRSWFRWWHAMSIYYCSFFSTAYTVRCTSRKSRHKGLEPGVSKLSFINHLPLIMSLKYQSRLTFFMFYRR